MDENEDNSSSKNEHDTREDTFQQQFNKESLENQRKLLERLESIQNDLNEMKESQKTEKSIQATSNSINIHQTREPTMPCSFVLKTVFKDVSKMELDNFKESEIENHFKVPWRLKIIRHLNHLAVFLRCDRSDSAEKWSIDIDYEMKFVHPEGKTHSLNETHCFTKRQGWGHYDFIEWEQMLKDYLVNDTLTVEVRVTIKEMTGIYKKKSRSFDESMKDVSDVVLIVEDEQFHVSKLFLATHSSFFKAMFVGRFHESNKSEITLNGIDAFDFQNYLEILYGDFYINESIVEEMLHLADMYDTPIVIRKCEEFLLKDSKTLLMDNFRMSARYNLEKLKEKCLSEINTIEDIRSVIPGDINDLDRSISNALLEKALSFK